MRLKFRRFLFFAAVAWIVSTPQGHAQTAYAIELGNILIRFDLAMPGVVTTIGTFSGAASFLDGLDFRPADGLLYGYDRTSNQLVTVNPNNATTTFVSTPTTASNTGALGIDFNPVADRLRLVNIGDQNLRINVDSGATIVDGTLAYAPADPHFGAKPFIIEAAYTNNDIDSGTGTLLYYIDFYSGRLVSTTNPNGGTLNTVGPLGVNTSSLVGFDIYTDLFGNNFAYALLNNILHSINLTTGAAMPLGATGRSGVYGLAIRPAGAPEGGTTVALLGVGLLGVAALRRRLSGRSARR